MLDKSNLKKTAFVQEIASRARYIDHLVTCLNVIPSYPDNNDVRTRYHAQLEDECEKLAELLNA